MNSLFVDTIMKDIDDKDEFKTERWIETGYDYEVEEYHKLQNGGCIVKLKNDEGRDDDETSKGNRKPSLLRALVSTNSRRIMNRFIV